jgi:hypothetical protein
LADLAQTLSPKQQEQTRGLLGRVFRRS